MQEIQTDCFGSYKNFSFYKFYTNGMVFNTQTNRALGFSGKTKNNKKKMILVEGYGSLEIAKIMAWLFLLNEEPGIEYDEIEVEYLDGDMTNCAIENIKISSNIGRPSKYLYLVKKGDVSYNEFKRADLAKHLGKSISWIDTHINTGEYFIWNNGLYTITDDIFFTYDYM